MTHYFSFRYTKNNCYGNRCFSWGESLLSIYISSLYIQILNVPRKNESLIDNAKYLHIMLQRRKWNIHIGILPPMFLINHTNSFPVYFIKTKTIYLSKIIPGLKSSAKRSCVQDTLLLFREDNTICNTIHQRLIKLNLYKAGQTLVNITYMRHILWLN